MKILFSSVSYPPSIGGLEVVSALLAREFAALGHQVKVVTRTKSPANDDNAAGFAVCRRPSSAELFQMVSWCDVYFHNNISLLTAWPLLFVRRPWIVAHHCWLPRRGDIDWYRGALKRALLPAAYNIAISRAVARDLNIPAIVIENPYEDQLFRIEEPCPRDRELIFVGRLVPDKGVSILLHALAALAKDGKRPRCTIVGDGPCRTQLETLAHELGVSQQVAFAGSLRGRELVQKLNRHRIMVVPSTWEEPFGIVALEGMACGCEVIAAQSGGLVDAVGTVGLTFPKGDSIALARVLARTLEGPDNSASHGTKREEHLRQHSPRLVAGRYVEVFDRALGRPLLHSAA